MRKFLLALPIVLAGCAGGGGQLTSDQVALIAQQIQAYTSAACAFQPTVATLSGLISAFYTPASVVSTLAAQIGDTICKAPTTSASVRRGVTTVTKIVPTPKGNVVVKGTAYGAVR